MDSQTSATLAAGREGGHSGSVASMFQGGEDAAILQNGSGAAGIGPVKAATPVAVTERQTALSAAAIVRKSPFIIFILPDPHCELAVCLRGENQLIGGCGLVISDADSRRAWIGYCLNRDYWSRGRQTPATQVRNLFVPQTRRIRHLVYAEGGGAALTWAGSRTYHISSRRSRPRPLCPGPAVFTAFRRGPS